MTEFDLDRAVRADRRAPLPGLPDANITIAAVRRRTSLEAERAETSGPDDRSSRLHKVLSVAGMATALGVAGLFARSGHPYLLFAITSIELVTLKTLIKPDQGGSNHE